MHLNNGFILIGLPSMLQYFRAEVVVSSNSSKQLEAPPGMFGIHDCLMVRYKSMSTLNAPRNWMLSCLGIFILVLSPFSSVQVTFNEFWEFFEAAEGLCQNEKFHPDGYWSNMHASCLRQQDVRSTQN